MDEYDTLLQVQYGIVDCSGNTFTHTIYGTGVLQDVKRAIAGKSLVVALDQATHKTGVCIMEFSTRKVIAAMDLINLGFPSKTLYFESIFRFLYNLVSNEDIKCFVYEIPVEHSSNLRTRALLDEMYKYIEGFSKRMPSLNENNMIAINSNTWKSHFLSSSQYAGKRKARADAKESARIEAASRAPELRSFFYRTGTPPDCCDAVGIAYGALEEVYSAKNPTLRRPNKTMPRKNIKFKQEIVPMRPAEIATYLAEHYASYYTSKQFELLEFNNELTVEDNCRRYCGTTKQLGLFPVSDPKTVQELKWEIGKELRPGEVYVVLCVRG